MKKISLILVLFAFLATIQLSAEFEIEEVVNQLQLMQLHHLLFSL